MFHKVIALLEYIDLFMAGVHGEDSRLAIRILQLSAYYASIKPDAFRYILYYTYDGA